MANFIKAFIFLGFIVVAMVHCKPGVKQIAFIRYETTGCFHSEKITLEIFEKEHTTFARLKLRDSSSTVSLKPEQMAAFNLFLGQLKALKPAKGFCTTHQYYKVWTGGEAIEKVDDQCQWDGFELLVKSFFPVSGTQKIDTSLSISSRKIV